MKTKIPLDAAADLTQAGHCSCKACCQLYSERFLYSAAGLDRNLEIVPCSYDSPDSPDRGDVWEDIQDDTRWTADDRACR